MLDWFASFLSSLFLGPLLVGGSLGALLVYLALKAKSAGLAARAARLPQLESELAATRAELQQSREDIARLSERNQRSDALEAEIKTLNHQQQQYLAKIAELETQLKHERSTNQEKLEFLQKARDELKTEFQNVAHKIFDEKGQKFSAATENLLKPFREQLAEFRKKVEEVQREDQSQRASLKTALEKEISNLKELHASLSNEARNLTLALKGDAKMRGNWGEMILEKVLESSGLSKGREYSREVFIQTDEGRYRPDAIIHLPDQKDVIVDTKVSLLAYERYASASDDETRAIALKEHLAAVRLHMKQLAARRYDQLLGERSLDFVLMFVPIEPALLLAWEHDPTLISDAFEQRVFLVNPSTLFAVLRVVQNLWRYDTQNKYAMDIAKRGGELYDKFVDVLHDFTKAEKSLQAATTAFGAAKERLATGKGNVLRQVEMLKELGAKVSKQPPANLLEQAMAANEKILVDESA